MPRIPHDISILKMCVLFASSVTLKVCMQITKRSQSEDVLINNKFRVVEVRISESQNFRAVEEYD